MATAIEAPKISMKHELLTLTVMLLAPLAALHADEPAPSRFAHFITRQAASSSTYAAPSRVFPAAFSKSRRIASHPRTGARRSKILPSTTPQC
jgi:hypothetical protein